jgi:hypothetical protein
MSDTYARYSCEFKCYEDSIIHQTYDLPDKLSTSIECPGYPGLTLSCFVFKQAKNGIFWDGLRRKALVGNVEVPIDCENLGYVELCLTHK